MEVLVVVLIITILATLVGVQVAGGPGKARVATAKAQIQRLRTALQLYRADNDRYPNQAQGLQALVQAPTVPPVPATYPREGYLESPNLPKDPWGNPYLYLIPGSHAEAYEIISYGADGAPGGEDEDADITSSEL
jgi:general secretion pathway protein G